MHLGLVDMANLDYSVLPSGAAKTYYKSLSQGESLERHGKADARKKTRRHRERLLQVSDKCACFKLVLYILALYTEIE